MPQLEHLKRCLGKLPPQEDPRRMMFAAYSSAATLPPPPIQCDRTYGHTIWGMMGNERAGCCAYAAVAHHGSAWSMGTTGKPLLISAEQVIQAYARGTGYDPVTGANDRGSLLINVLEEWRTRGFGTNRIAAHAGIDLRDPMNIREAVYYYGGAYCGIQLPQTAMEQTEAGLGWTVPWFSANLGGHAISVLSYNATHLWCVTWGAVQVMTWEFFMKFADEAYAIINPLWLDASGLSPTGLRLDALISDLAAVAA
jgi:hypothetical protein